MKNDWGNECIKWKRLGESYYSPCHDVASAEENELNSKMYDFGEKFFSDMMFEQDSIVGKYLECKTSENIYDEEMIDYMPIPELSIFSYDMVICKIESMEKDYMGCFNEAEMTLTVGPEFVNDDHVILHEMIHIHEFLLSKIDVLYRDILFYELYKKISNEIDNINDLMDMWCNGVNQLGIKQKGGRHSPLFLLKSLDIDLQCGYELGTTMGYGSVEEFKKILRI